MRYFVLNVYSLAKQWRSPTLRHFPPKTRVQGLRSRKANSEIAEWTPIADQILDKKNWEGGREGGKIK